MTDTNERLLRSIITRQFGLTTEYYALKVKQGIVTMKNRYKNRYIELNLNVGTYDVYVLEGEKQIPVVPTEDETSIVLELVEFSGNFGDY